jgi:shikimate dehydrogenase
MVRQKMRKFWLIGFHLSHSISRQFFTEKFEREQLQDCRYELFAIETVAGLAGLLKADPTLCGLNVTIPHKVNVIPLLTEIDEAAKQIGAVNCIDIGRIGPELTLKGYNTDAYGFSESLKPLLEQQHQKALVFGNGGAAKAVKYVLNQLHIPFKVVLRKPAPGALLYPDVTAAMLDQHKLLINTTPLGMMPHVDSCPQIPYQELSKEHLAYDLVYNPEETLFLKKAKLQGAKVKNGLEMLILQAERSWAIWNHPLSTRHE